MSFNRKTTSTTGKQSKSKSATLKKAPKDEKPTQQQTAPLRDRVTHDMTRTE